VTTAIDGPAQAPEHCHCKLALEGRGRLTVVGPWRHEVRSPRSVGGANTQTAHVQLPAGLDQHGERARAAGAVTDQQPEEQFCGDRTYRAIDPEGHLWSSAQRVAHVSRAEAERALGRPIRSGPWG